MCEGVGALHRLQCGPRLDERVVVPALSGKDEQAPVQLPRRSAVIQESAGTATTVTSCPTAGRGGRPAVLQQLAALGFVPCEDLQAEGYGAYRNLLNQAATSEGAKR
jgi:hypothetical protein